MSFLPPAPHNALAVPVLAEPPKIESNPYLAETPSFLYPKMPVPPKPSGADMRVERANTLFANGKKLYQAGDLEGARKEFDHAVDVLLNAPDAMKDRSKVEKRLEEIVAAIHRYDVNGMGSGDPTGQLGYDKAPLEDILEMTFPVDPDLKPKVKEQLLATSSQLPLELNDAVLSYIHYFSGDKGKRTLIAGLKRSGRYRPLISRILSEEGVPQELIYLAQAESGFLPRAVSYKAATGMWQFMQWRGREYGLNQTAYSDDRLDPEKATRAAARHLRDLYNSFGDWYLAIAGYNCGPGGVEKAVERTGYADFWQLRSRNALPKETTNYVPIIVAMTIMAKNPKEYGLEELDLDQPLEYETVTVSAPTHINLVADIAERPVSDLRDLNPALLSNVAPSGYELRVPKGTHQTILAALEAIPVTRRASSRIHHVSQGDTLASIAKQYNTTASSIAAVNNSSDALLGSTLLIPASLDEARAKVRSKAKPTARRRAPAKRSTNARKHTGPKLQTASLH